MNANFDIRDYLNYPELDITFIPGLILDMAKLNNDPFYKANSLMRKNCNGQITHCKKDDDKLLESYKSLIVKQLGF